MVGELGGASVVAGACEVEEAVLLVVAVSAKVCVSKAPGQSDE